MDLPSLPAVHGSLESVHRPNASKADQLERADRIHAQQGGSELQEAFTDFVGQTLFGSMLASMRETVGKPAYFDGGRTEEVFQKQLDQQIVEQLTDASAESIAEPMFELFNLQRR